MTPGVVYLASGRRALNGRDPHRRRRRLFAVAKIYETEGAYLGDHLSAEAVRDNWSKITDPTGEQSYAAGQEQTQKFLRRVMGQ